ncbi:MAG TPA: nicotinate-nucleotide adenylyltransferase [Levilinea sp.]|nr:nicotinate-nucleotide adenylyltransferase [Levilinea sp.]
MRLGVFGGTFDPPHIGHLILAAEASSQLELDRLLWVLTPYPPHKQNQSVSLLEQRLVLVQAVLAQDETFELSQVEIERPAPHFAVDTVELLQAQYPGASLIYLIGGDSLRDLPTWREPQRFMRNVAGLGVMRRPGDQVELDQLEAALPGLRKKLLVIRAPLLEISSSDLRQRIASGRPFRYYLAPAVYDLIVQRGYYR